MNFTPEQKKVVSSKGDIIVNSVAGSGKTTTLLGYAKERPDAKILYLAFNKSVKNEAIRKFNQMNVQNVTIETAHSLAHRVIVRKYNYSVRANYKISDLIKILGLSNNKNTIAILVHAKRFISYFCNSSAERVKDLNFIDVVTNDKAKEFVKAHYKSIETCTRNILSKMDSGEIDITHDFYLKKYQLSKPILDYDYILFDEGQDASPTMLDIFLRQRATKVIVGDTHQQIYGWRFAINSLEVCKFKTLYLSNSFRFPQTIADLANITLESKSRIFNKYPLKIKGSGTSKDRKTKAVISRTTVALLIKAIKYMDDFPKIYFEGNLSSYMYADSGPSIYDVYSLYNGRNEYIKDETLRSMKDYAELLEYIETTDDQQLHNITEIVEKYGDSIPNIFKQLKDCQVEKEEAQIIYSTVHRAKGMEYDLVEITDDFITEETLDKFLKDKDITDQAIAEEINILYVAITRAKNILYIPEKLVPKDFPSSTHIVPIKSKYFNPFLPKSKVSDKPSNSKSGSKSGGVVYLPIQDEFYGFNTNGKKL